MYTCITCIVSAACSFDLESSCLTSPRMSISDKNCLAVHSCRAENQGADFVGKRLNTLYAESVNEARDTKIKIA